MIVRHATVSFRQSLRLAWELAREAPRITFMGECKCGCGKYVVKFKGDVYSIKRGTYYRLYRMAYK